MMIVFLNKDERPELAIQLIKDVKNMTDVGIWTYGELPCRQRLGPTGGSHATRDCGLLVAARSS
jgi:hypothetical protein